MKAKKNVNETQQIKREELLLDLMNELSYYQSKDGLCVTIFYGERKESVPVTSQQYSDYMCAKYYENYQTLIKPDLVKDCLQIIRHLQKEQYVDEVIFEKRYAEQDDNIFINMANGDLQYISVSSNGYEIITPDNDTPLFVTNALESPMLRPKGKSIKSLGLLDDLLNLKDDDKFFLKVWLISAMHPSVRTPILFFRGSAGSGKTSIQNLLRDLLNPSERGAVNWDGTSTKELTIALSRSYLINFDNVSKIDQVRSDILCQATTGGKKSFRKLYTDNQELNYDLQARVTLSSIKNCISASDLAERVYFMNMPKISQKSRIPEDKYEMYYRRNLPKIFGGLLTTLSYAMEYYEQWCEDHNATYRLASFELFGGLVANILDEDNGYERFMKIMRRNQLIQAFPNDYKRPYFESMLELLDADGTTFTGKVKDFYDYINDWILEYSELPYSDDIILSYDVFVKSLHKYKDGISSLGYDIEFFMSRPDNYSSIRIGKYEEPKPA